MDDKMLIEILEKLLVAQEKLVELTEGMHKLMREMNVRIVDKLAKL